MNRVRRHAATTGILVLSALSLLPLAAHGGQFTHPTGVYTLTYPDRWTCDTGGVSIKDGGTSGPTFTTFPREDYIPGGIIPKGGARIFVNAYPKDTDEYARLYEMALSEGATDLKRDRRPEGAVRVQFLETWEAGTFKEVWISQPRGDRLLEFMLSYYTDDPKGISYERDLDTIVSGSSPSGIVSTSSLPTPPP